MQQPTATIRHTRNIFEDRNASLSDFFILIVSSCLEQVGALRPPGGPSATHIRRVCHVHCMHIAAPPAHQAYVVCITFSAVRGDKYNAQISDGLKKWIARATRYSSRVITRNIRTEIRRQNVREGLFCVRFIWPRTPASTAVVVHLYTPFFWLKIP